MRWNALFALWTRRKSNSLLATQVYQMLVAASRDPFLFETVRVPDSPQGRFESVILHMFLLQRRLKEIHTARPLAQTLMDRMADDLDRSIREMGVGDLSVGKNVKSLLQMAEQRFELYESRFDKRCEMEDILGEIFSAETTPGKSVQIDLLNRYMAGFANKLSEYEDRDLTRTGFSLPIVKMSDLQKNG